MDTEPNKTSEKTPENIKQLGSVVDTLSEIVAELDFAKNTPTSNWEEENIDIEELKEKFNAAATVLEDIFETNLFEGLRLSNFLSTCTALEDLLKLLEGIEEHQSDKNPQVENLRNKVKTQLENIGDIMQETVSVPVAEGSSEERNFDTVQFNVLYLLETDNDRYKNLNRFFTVNFERIFSFGAVIAHNAYCGVTDPEVKQKFANAFVSKYAVSEETILSTSTDEAILIAMAIKDFPELGCNLLFKYTPLDSEEARRMISVWNLSQPAGETLKNLLLFLRSPNIGLDGVRKLSKDYGIYNFGRYSEDFLANLLVEDNNSEYEYGLMIKVYPDHNGSFINPYLIDEIKKNLQKGFPAMTLRAVEIGSMKDLVKRLSLLHKKFPDRKIKFVIFQAHGSEKVMQVGSNEEGAIDIERDLISAEAAPGAHRLGEKMLDTNAQVVLASCKTGKDNGIAERVHDFFGRRVLAPKVNTSLKEVSFSHNLQSGSLVIHPKYGDGSPAVQIFG